jgi:hypothetical protein
MHSDGWWRKLRSNIPFALSAAAAAGIVLLSLLPRFSGSTAWVLRAVAIVLATFGPIATQVEKRRADEAKRLDVSLATRQEQITPFPTEHQLIEEWLADEQEACLLSIKRYEQLQAQSSRRKSFEVGRLRGPTVGEVLDLEKRDALGEQLTPEERDTLSQAQKAFGEVVGKFSATVNLFSRPEGRTPQQYRDEVSAYLDNARAAVWLRLTEEFVAAGLGRIQVELMNGTDRPFESVIVEVGLPLGVEVFTETEPREERETIPPRPREFGERETTNVGCIPRLPELSQLTRRPNWPAPPEPQIRIESRDSVKVTFPGVGLRPFGTTLLPELFVVVRQDPGSTLEIGWEATAANANGRVVGRIVLNVGTPPSPDGVLRRILQDRGLDMDC